MNLETKDAVAQRPGGGWRAAQLTDFELGEARDLVEQEGAKGGGQRQVVLLGLAEAVEHVAQDVGDLAGRQLELGKRTLSSLHRAWPWAPVPAERAVPGESVGGIVDVAVETPEPLLREQRLGVDVSLLMGARKDRLDAVIERLQLEPQGAGGLRLPAAQDGKADRVEQVRLLGNEHARVQHHAHAGVIWTPIDLDVGICDHRT